MRPIVAFVNEHSLRVTILGLNYAPEPTGNAPYTTSLATGLAAAGHKVRVIAGYPHYPEWTLAEGYSGWSRLERVEGIEVQRLRHYVPKNPRQLSRLHMEFSFGLRLLFARWHNPDVVLVVSPALFASALAILRVRTSLRRPSVAIWVQDIYSRGVEQTGMGSTTASKLVALAESWILRSCDGVVAIHDRFRDYFVGSLGVPSSDVKVIRNWTHLPSTPVGDHASLRSSLGWEPEDVVVLHAGNMGKKQGLENVVEAARLAEETDSCVRFVLMGDGNQRRHLEALAAGLTRVMFIDPLPNDQFQLALAAADILLVNELPGVKDMAVPSKLTSYFNSGVPVLAASDAGSVTSSEVERSGGGVRVDAANPEALLRAAEQLGADSEASARLGAQGLRFRRETLSEAVAVAHYDEFIRSLASSRAR